MTDAEGTEMSEYINRKALEKALMAAAANDKDKNRRTWAKAICVLHDAPSVDAVPVVHAEWIKSKKYDMESRLYCSSCKQEYDYIDGIYYLVAGSELPFYCPNCGAAMNWEENAE